MTYTTGFSKMADGSPGRRMEGKQESQDRGSGSAVSRAVLQKKGMEPPADPEPAQPSWADPVDPDRPMVALTFDDGPRASVD